MNITNTTLFIPSTHINLFGFNLTLITVLVVWTLFWKAIALWKSGRNNQPIWFIILFLINTIGILEILYIFLFQKGKHRRSYFRRR